MSEEATAAVASTVNAVLNPEAATSTPPAQSPTPAATALSSEVKQPDGDWFAKFDGDTKAWLDAKGLTKAEKELALENLVKGYRSAEQKLGVPADQLVKLPGKDAKPEDIKNLMLKLGASDKVDDYVLEVPEGESNEFAKVAQGWFHKFNLPVNMAQELVKEYNAYAATLQQKNGDIFEVESQRQMDALKTKWGNDHDINLEIASRAAKYARGDSIGMTSEDVESLERAIGTEKTMLLFYNLGQQFREDVIHGKGDSQFGMSANAAKARIESLKRDTDWQREWIKGDADKQQEWTRLHQLAYPQ